MKYSQFFLLEEILLDMCMYILLKNRIFIVVNFIFSNFNIIKRYNFFIHFSYVRKKFTLQCSTFLLKFIAFCYENHHILLAEIENYLKKVPLMTNNTLTQTIGFPDINSFRHINPIIY